MKKFTIEEVTEWEEDSVLMDGDASHEGYRSVQSLLEEERESKIDNGEQKGLPFTCEAENEDEAIEKYNQSVCEFDYLKAVAVEFAE